MATKVFLGKGVPSAIPQVTTVQVTLYHADGVYTITVGTAPHTYAVTVNADTDEDTTAASLSAAWNAATHPYCTGITASGQPTP